MSKANFGRNLVFSYCDESHCCHARYKLWVDKQAAHLTMQSCMILFQSSPVTIRKRTVMALPAVEKLACLQRGDGKADDAPLYHVPETLPE